MLSYRAEERIGSLLGAAGHPVASWTVVEVSGTLCSVAPLLAGVPVDYGAPFSREFADALGRLLGDLHALPADGFGPLLDDSQNLGGRSASVRSGITDRWCHASIWPFDDSHLSNHPLVHIAPGAIGRVGALRSEILAAGEERIGVLHSDLHQQHLLQGEGGGLSAVLDFGASFVGSVAWDYAVLRWYYGAANADRVAESRPEGAILSDAARCLAVAVGLYKLAKKPSDPAVHRRLRRTLDAIR